jgi:adenosylcobyric acid synthase
MVQGTSSSAGKSWMVTALCHIFARRGVRVAPFKAQNMSNNAAICPDGAEIGRAQAVQAMAAGISPSGDMNPVLIKPEADARSQVVLAGRAWRTLSARDYYRHKPVLWEAITAAFGRLSAAYDLVILEGAGSPVELNLKAGDFVNMAMARHAGAPVLLVGDIDRGGIFAQLLGTLWLLPEEERALVKGLIVNKFRGDLSLFSDGVEILEEKGGVPVLGVVPYLPGLAIPEEDAVALEEGPPGPPASDAGGRAWVEIAVIHLPRIANFDDFDPLAAEEGVRLRYVTDPATLGRPQAVILPGTKSTVADLEWLRSRGLDRAIQDFARRGGAVAGICGGYQMLGQAIRDPGRAESTAGLAAGLGLLPVETVFAVEKATFQARGRLRGRAGWLASLAGQTVEGYEIHLGQTEGAEPFLEITERNRQAAQVLDGSSSPDGRIWGCYLHGLFANENLRRAWLASLGWRTPAGQEKPFGPDFARLGEAVEAALDMPRLEKIIWAG